MLKCLEEFEIIAEKTGGCRKETSRRLRRLEDKVPGIIYGGKRKPNKILP